MTTQQEDQKIKQTVRSFYDQVGWKEIANGVYQNARFEDLRPVSREYIHRCHLRAGSFLAKTGELLLDAGSGPIQYPEYLTYSEGYRFRVCVDLSIVALQEARRRIGVHGLYVVADVSMLPFPKEKFDGIVSLHTLHHLTPMEQRAAYLEIWRVLVTGRKAIIVNGWTDAPLMRRLDFLVNIMERAQRKLMNHDSIPLRTNTHIYAKDNPEEGAGTYVQKFTPKKLEEILGGLIKYEIRCWRSISVRFMRAVIHRRLAGKLKLRLLFWLENRFAHFLGVIGQYPLIILKKSGEIGVCHGLD